MGISSAVTKRIPAASGPVLMLAALPLFALFGAASPLTGRADSVELPSYVLDYAPIVYLDEEEKWFPGSMSSQLENTSPFLNGQKITTGPSPLTLSNLGDLDATPDSNGGKNISLDSNDDFTQYPAWLEGTAPDSSGKTPGDPSAAIIANDHGDGTLIAFYMYFYNFNEGNKVLGEDAGNHVGDWEHNAILFQDGVPQSVWFSQHADGEAFTYDAVEKQGKRVVSYSARGTHANYAQAGKHDHTIPGLNLPFSFFLTDYTSNGPLWDPTLNFWGYTYASSPSSFAAASSGPGADGPTSWLSYTGIWGDPELPKTDPRQHYLLGIKASEEWSGGPTGPEDKKLDRAQICPSTPCVVRPVIGAK